MKRIFFFILFVLIGLTPALQVSALEFPTMADLEPGSLIKSAQTSAVYYFGEDERRYAFPNEETYYTWYEDFQSVQTIAVSQMNSIAYGGAVAYAPQFGNDGASTRLLKLASKSTVYVPIGYGMLAAIKNEDQANRLFGDRWMDYIDVLPDAFAPLYTWLSGTLSDEASFVEPYDYTISTDLRLDATTGVLLYEEPLRFTAHDEQGDCVSQQACCSEGYCGFNVVSVTSGQTLKFVNYTSQSLTIRETNQNLFSTGVMDPGDIIVIKIDLEEGVYDFRADEDWAMTGVLIVE